MVFILKNGFWLMFVRMIKKIEKKGCTKIGSPYNATTLTRGATLKSKAATSWRQVKLKLEASSKEIQN
ncbi:hypothetical protein CBQ28_22835, partial [Pseudoalteromonas sp. GCY]